MDSGEERVEAVLATKGATAVAVEHMVIRLMRENRDGEGRGSRASVDWGPEVSNATKVKVAAGEVIPMVAFNGALNGATWGEFCLVYSPIIRANFARNCHH